MPTTPYAKLLVSVDGAAPVDGAVSVIHDNVLQLVPESTVGWRTAATVYEITGFPLGWTAPAGWVYDAGRHYFTYYANGSHGTAPPPLTMPAQAAIDAGMWGKFKFRLRVNGGGGQLTDWTLAAELASASGIKDTARDEDTEFGGPMKFVASLQENWHALDALVQAGAMGGVALGSGTPGHVSAAAGGQGASLFAARFDHTHQADTGTPVAIGTVLGAGVLFTLARADHVHTLPWATVVSVFAGASSALDMNGKKITGLGAPTPGSTDAATAAYADGVVTFAAVLAALGAASGPININGVVITGSGAPSAGSSNLATTLYVDGAVAAAVAGYVPLTRMLTAGDGLSGGGDLSADRSFAVQAHDASVVAAPTGIKVQLADGSLVLLGGGLSVGVINGTQHGNLGGGALHALAVAGSPGTPGFLSGPYATLLAGAASTATAGVIAMRDGAGKLWGVGLDAGAAKVTHVDTPTASDDAATKGYVDMLAKPTTGTASTVAGMLVEDVVDDGFGKPKLKVTGHGLLTGAHVRIYGVSGATGTNTAHDTITWVDADHFIRDNGTFGGVYTSGGMVLPMAQSTLAIPVPALGSAPLVIDVGSFRVVASNPASPSVVAQERHATFLVVGSVVVPVDEDALTTLEVGETACVWAKVVNVTNAGGVFKVETKEKHHRFTGESVRIRDVVGCPDAIGVWPITVTSDTEFTLGGSTFAGAYVFGGVVDFLIDGALIHAAECYTVSGNQIKAWVPASPKMALDWTIAASGVVSVPPA